MDRHPVVVLDQLHESPQARLGIRLFHALRIARCPRHADRAAFYEGAKEAADDSRNHRDAGYRRMDARDDPFRFLPSVRMAAVRESREDSADDVRYHDADQYEAAAARDYLGDRRFNRVLRHQGRDFHYQHRWKLSRLWPSDELHFRKQRDCARVDHHHSVNALFTAERSPYRSPHRNRHRNVSL